ncbi:TetR/AcrR family transcriptional regulator [Nocardia sp. NPDC050406]|uniref:TetR/AcrR family transcriptional regulator n=1 Tax=Nocardia sp. NPDC050406 TaxID=3364318 RepID=UPI0037AAB353
MTTGKQRGGRPRDSRIDHSVLEATRTLLARHGYTGLTVDAVAAAAGVGKPAIYRRFPSKAALVFAAVVHPPEFAEPPDHGSLRADLRAMVHEVYRVLSSGPTREVGPHIMAEVATNPELSERFRDLILSAELDQVGIILDRATARGELTTRPDPLILNCLLSGPQFYAIFGFHLELEAAQLDSIADTVAAGVLACAS